MSRKLLAALLLLPGMAQAQTVVLENGAPVAIANTPQGTVRDYSLEVPADMTTLRVILTGGAGDADLYVHYNEPFFSSSDPQADCESISPGSTEEECIVSLPTAGTWYIQVDAFDDYGAVGGDQVRLVAVAAEALDDNVNRGPLSGALASLRWFYIDVPASQGHLNVTTTGGTGNPNLKVAADLFAAADCTSGASDTAESCAIDQPAAGLWYIRLAGTAAYSGVTLNAEYGPERAPNAGLVASGPMTPLTLAGLLLAGLVAAARRRPAGSA
jgi:hypothetical protein